MPLTAAAQKEMAAFDPAKRDPVSFCMPLGTPRNTLATDKMKVTTTIPSGAPAGYFSMVREIAFPIVVGTRPEDYKVFVAFDRNVPNAG